jgi:hypothetical protein
MKKSGPHSEGRTGKAFNERDAHGLADRPSLAYVHLDEVGLYTVCNGKIVEERFFMGGA